MSTYLLPCACGEKIEITPGQAGQFLRCSCGREVEAPTVRGLAALERKAVAQPPTAASPWGVGQAAILLGLAIAVCGLANAVRLHVQRPDRIDLTEVSKQIGNVPPGAAWSLWSSFEDGGVHRELTPEESEWTANNSQRNAWIWVSAVVGVLGLVLAGVAWFSRSGPRPGPVKVAAQAPAAKRTGAGSGPS